jgi:hypothetical protein
MGESCSTQKKYMLGWKLLGIHVLWWNGWENNSKMTLRRRRYSKFTPSYQLDVFTPTSRSNNLLCLLQRPYLSSHHMSAGWTFSGLWWHFKFATLIKRQIWINNFRPVCLCMHWVICEYWDLYSPAVPMTSTSILTHILMNIFGFQCYHNLCVWHDIFKQDVQLFRLPKYSSLPVRTFLRGLGLR